MRIPFFKKNNEPLKIGIVFGGGGARGFGHIGVIRAFEEHGIKPHFICGTSIGSLVGAAWASGASSEQLLELAKDIKEKDIRQNKILPFGSSAKGIEELAIKAMGGNKMFSELFVPFSCVAVDINSGVEKRFESGFVAKCVSASCCVPAVFSPVEIEGKNYVDGGLLNTIPTDLAKEKRCDVIIGVDINSTRGYGSETTKLVDVVMATIRIMGTSNAMNGYKHADVMIKPNLKRFKVHKFEGNIDMIEEGYSAAIEAMPEIKKKIAEAKPHYKKVRIEIRKQKKKLKKELKEHKNKIKAIKAANKNRIKLTMEK